MFERGSEWRRWDLHVHTPGTAKNDQYTGDNIEEKWKNFYAEIHKYVNTSNDPVHSIAAIGITDYVLIDNYLRVLKDDRLPKCIQLVIPNIEMRLSLGAKQNLVNIHFLFDPDIVDKLNMWFFSKLQVTGLNNVPVSAVKEELIELGRSLDSSLDDQKALEKGIDNFNPAYQNIIKLFQENPKLREHTLIGLANGNNDGASGMNGSLEAEHKNLYRFVDFIFSGNPTDRRYFLGKKSDSPEVIKEKYGSLKPCIHGSDAHKLEELFRPKQDRFCWIKADTTFNGLKQIVYEPEQRVYISQNADDLPFKRENHQIIDHIELDEDDFAPEKIYLNSRLNCIIGGKSTGKSLLLHNIASAIDQKQVNEKAEKTGLKGSRELKNIKIFWKDGSADEAENESSHKILYIPQTYLNRLSDEEQEKNEIDSIIEDVLFQNASIKQAYQQMEEKIDELKQKYGQLCLNLLHANNRSNELAGHIKELGTENSIQQEITELEARKQEIHQKSAILDAESAEYETLSQKYDQLRKQNVNLLKIADGTDLLHPYLDTYDFIHELTAINPGIDLLRDDFINGLIQKMESTFEEIKGAAAQQWEKTLDEIKSQITEKIEKNIAAEQADQGRLVELCAKLEANSSFKKVSQGLASENKKLDTIRGLNKSLDESQKEYVSLRKELAGSFEEFQRVHSEYADMLNANQDMKQSGLEFSVKTVFRDTAFGEKAGSLFDKRNLRAQKNIIDTDEFNVDDFSMDKREKLIDECIAGNRLKTVRGYTAELALRDIFTDWYNTTYSVSMEGDQIDRMSPGKKALVLLKLMISLANNRYPILIDQPEDDLDNRSIFRELIPFIVKKKQERQFIVVTHNANVVLGADAEEIIVANQDGESTPNKDNVQFEYLSGSIENNVPCDKKSKCVLESRSIQEHICDILEGGKEAFDLRKKKYHI